MKEMEKFKTEQKRVISRLDCLSSNVYGMIVSNGVIEEKFYFDETGELYNITPMVKMDGQFIDGEQASISCYDIIQSEASSLDLSCDNITHIEQEVIDDATLIKNVFTADIKDDDTLCRCRSNKSNSESMLNIHIFPYKGYNVSHRKEVCESNSEIKLTCHDDNLPDVFHFGKWFHHYNDVEICKLAGFSSGKHTFIQIPFCTYEDIGNYTCSITDTRKNTTVFYSTTFLSVPGPPVIVNSSLVKYKSKAECLLSVEFYSFDEISTLTWYKNGRLLHSSEHQRPNVRQTTHIVNMHNKDVPIKAKIATLQLKRVCDVDTSIYRLTVKTAHFSTSHTFEQEDNTVHTVLIMSSLIATGIVMTGLIIIICRFTKGRKKKFRFNRKSLYTSNAVVGRRIDTQFYEEIDMFIENLRQADEETTGHNRYTMSENEYEQIPFDRE
ncbi:uncharacterized protein LOC143080008 [Mytilus galloprovincialis]|uniref:uncharacterized protein LOC143080008 n=1 Tax=Mytilus galloprovincialis TaxID=29158 RepID=UPI003F7C2C87